MAAAGDGSDARAALETLCTAYWLPVYGYVRSKHREAAIEDAYDLTQGFFADLLARRSLAAADANRGKFRAFLLTSLKNYLVNQAARRHAQKRGGERTILPLDPDGAESRWAAWPSTARTAEQEFEQRWALALLDRVLARLSEEQAAAGRAVAFRALRPLLTGEHGQTQTELAKKLGTSPEAVRSALYRLRNRYREILRQEVAETVERPEDVDDELRRLIAAVGS